MGVGLEAVSQWRFNIEVLMVTALRLSPTFRELFRKGRSWRYFLITKYCNFGASEELNLVASNEEDPTVEANGKVCTGYSSWFKPHSCSASQGGDLSCLHPCSFVIGVHSKDEKHEQPFSFGVHITLLEIWPPWDALLASSSLQCCSQLCLAYY